MADEEATIADEGGGAPVEEAGEFIPEAPAKPQNDMFTLLLILAFSAFLVGTLLAGSELHDFYDVQFFVFGKK